MGLLSRFGDGLFRQFIPDVNWDPNIVSYLAIAVSIFVPLVEQFWQIAFIAGVLLMDALDGYLARKKGVNNFFVDYLCDRVSEAAMFINNSLMLKLTIVNSILTAIKIKWRNAPRPIALRIIYLGWLVFF